MFYDCHERAGFKERCFCITQETVRHHVLYILFTVGLSRGCVVLEVTENAAGYQ